MDILSPLPHVSNVRFRLAIKKYFYKDIEPEYTQLIKDLIVGDAAETLDTLKELADALDNDSEFYTTVTTKFNELQQTVEDNELVTSAALNDLNTRKQEQLVSGENIKTINNESLLGPGNIDIVTVTDITTTEGICTITLSDGTTHQIDLPQGTEGRGILSVVLNADYTLTFNYTDGTTFTTPQSLRGEQGDRGEQGPQGIKGDTVVLGEVGEYKLYNVGGTATDGAMTQDATTKAIAAANGYYECGTAAGTAAKVAVGDNEALYTLQKGGSIKVKMTNANAAASGVTLKIGSAAATPLYYNGEAVSASNSWEAGEVISVYFDGSNYQATNAQGSGGKAEKIKYDNSASGLVATDVQWAIDEIVNGIGVSPNYTPNQSLDIDDKDIYPRTAAVVGTANQWGVGGKASSIFIPVGNASIIRVTANSSAKASVGFVTKNYETGDTSPSWASGWSSALRITADTYSDLSVPEDAEYLYVGMKTVSDITLKPASIIINDVSSINNRLKALADKDEDLTEDIEDINDELYEQSPAVIYTDGQVLDLTTYNKRKGSIGMNNTWNNGESYSNTYILIPVGNAFQFQATANSSYPFTYAWLKEDEVAVTGETPSFAEGETGRHTEITVETTGLTIPATPPADAKWLYVAATTNSGVDMLPTNINVYSINPNYIPPRDVSRITECEEEIDKCHDSDAELLNTITAIHGDYQAEDGDMNLNYIVDGKDNCTNSFWYYPAIMSTIFRHKRIYYGFNDNNGGAGVGCINAFDHRCWKTVLKKKLTQGTVDGVSGLYPDTHNIVCVQMLPDRRLISCYSEGHGDTPYLCIRISKNKEDITEWEDVIRINMGDRSTYAQYHYINGKHYIFARLTPSGGNPCNWAYVYSTDLETWSEPHTFLHQTNGYQYYIWLRPITDRPNMLRFAMYSNPTYNDMNIRCGIIDFENDVIYDYDGTTQVGTLTGATINSSAFTILVNQPSGSFATADKQRLHDLAVTPFDSFKIAYSITHTPFIGTYKTYEYANGSGVVKTICSTGEVYLNNNTTARNKGNASGLNFINPNKLFIGRSSEDSTGNDFMQIWEESEGAWTETKTVYSEAKGTEHLRNVLPLVDCNGRYAIWMRGYYNLDTYLGAETDFIVYDIENDIVF